MTGAGQNPYPVISANKATEEREEKKMALHWDFKKKAGLVTCKNGDVFNWYTGNAFMIVPNEWEENGREYYSMNWFMVDKDHAKNCLGLTRGYENIFTDNPIVEIEINREYTPHWKDIVIMFTKAFPDIKITLYSAD